MLTAVTVCRGRKLHAQVPALKVKRFHLCNQIAEARPRSRSRTPEDLEEHKMVDGRAADAPA